MAMNWINAKERPPQKGEAVLLWTHPDTEPAGPVVAMWDGTYFYNTLQASGAWWERSEVSHWAYITPPADAEGTH